MDFNQKREQEKNYLSKKNASGGGHYAEEILIFFT